MGARRPKPSAGSASSPSDMYTIPNRRTGGHVVSMPLVHETPVRTGNLRDPNGPQITFAAESFIDELAAAAKADPVEFRLRLLNAGKTDDSGFKRARSIACVKAAAEAYGWDPRPSPKPSVRSAGLQPASSRARDRLLLPQSDRRRAGRRSGSEQADRARVGEADRLRTRLRPGDQPRGAAPHGRVRHAALIEPRAARRGAVRHRKTTGVDWITHPTLRHADTPERIDVVIVNGDPNPNRPDLPHYGAGETVCKPLLAAVANAIFDATGVVCVACRSDPRVCSRR